MSTKKLADWLNLHPLTPIEVDCAITVMLKILDGKCKMIAEEKVVMAELYQSVKYQRSELLNTDIHELIDQAQNQIDEELKLIIYEKRLLAETMISRPIMKQFKAKIRNQGLFNAFRGEVA